MDGVGISNATEAVAQALLLLPNYEEVYFSIILTCFDLRTRCYQLWKSVCGDVSKERSGNTAKCGYCCITMQRDES